MIVFILCMIGGFSLFTIEETLGLLGYTVTTQFSAANWIMSAIGFIGASICYAFTKERIKELEDRLNMLTKTYDD